MALGYPGNSIEYAFEVFWDKTSKALYRYHRAKKLFATHDDERSLALKTQYAVDQKLNGVMFWELSLDKPKDGLLDAICNTLAR